MGYVYDEFRHSSIRRHESVATALDAMQSQSMMLPKSADPEPPRHHGRAPPKEVSSLSASL
jgi:hypothetical protein